jgi:hypothetical protein
MIATIKLRNACMVHCTWVVLTPACQVLLGSTLQGQAVELSYCRAFCTRTAVLEGVNRLLLRVPGAMRVQPTARCRHTMGTKCPQVLRLPLICHVLDLQ